ncbi:MAG: Mrp/NBP35 family ATP-binding protein [Xanthobacteraceae bacterium]|jgi:ATP-binding protein involved in chromosome partitioning
MTATSESITQALKSVKGPDGKDIVSSGKLSGVVVTGGKVFCSLTVDAAEAQAWEAVRKQAEELIKSLPGIASVLIALTAEKKGGAPSAPPPQQRAGGPGAQPAGRAVQGVPGVKAIIAVASGKGGVGKSTTAVNLALGLQSLGLKVGVLDADIYGPSMPRLLALKGKPELIGGRTLKPMEAFGLKVMSIGFLVDEDTPMIWRGPMVQSAITQMLREVDWAPLDVIVVDMPPGTGDAQLTLAQQVPLAGAVIVSTPQDLALIDARRGIAMFKRVDVPVLGLVENMSYFLCPHCGERSDIFSHGGARHEADRWNVQFLGEIPLELKIRETSDAGSPIVASDPDGPYAKIYKDIAAKVRGALEGTGGKRAAPRIVIES